MSLNFKVQMGNNNLIRDSHALRETRLFILHYDGENKTAAIVSWNKPLQVHTYSINLDSLCVPASVVGHCRFRGI